VTARRCFTVAAAITSVFFINFCATIFGCGCASLWNGADQHCNVHLAGSRHCPWCAHGLAASIIPWALIVAAQSAICFWSRPMHAAVRLLSAVAAFPVVGAVIAAAYGLATGYWR
jgi:hypothetical protein